MRSIPLDYMRFATFSGKHVRPALVGVALAGALATPALAEDDGFHPLDSVLRTLDLKTDVGAAPDFVQQSRPKEPSDFVPVGEQRPQAPLKVKTPAEVKAAEAELDAARIRHDQISGRKPAVPKSAASKAPVSKVKRGTTAAGARSAPATQN